LNGLCLGQGGMGVSNSLGANSLAILFSLGIPWFIKSLILKSSGQDGFIEIESGGIDYIILSLIIAVASLYTVLYLKKFYLMKVTGATIFVIYIVFIVVAILMESGIFFDVGLPAC
jgi:Ca2+/Na+ antiporter